MPHGPGNEGGFVHHLSRIMSGDAYDTIEVTVAAGAICFLAFPASFAPGAARAVMAGMGKKAFWMLMAISAGALALGAVAEIVGVPMFLKLLVE